MVAMNPASRAKGNDVHYTPSWVVDDMISVFRPSGIVLDPCRGQGQFSDKINNCLWCEISEGRDFYDFKDQVGTVIGNPPYSDIRKFVLHAMDIADRVIFLIPVWKAFNAIGLMEKTAEWGFISHIRTYGGGGKLGFPMGNAVGAVEWKRGNFRGTSYSFYNSAMESSE